MEISQTELGALRERCHAYLLTHAVGARVGEVAEGFSLHRHQAVADLYGMVDAVYILYTLGMLATDTSRDIRAAWAEQILASQDADGWFSERNLRGHSNEHSTAYAIGALRLLEVEEDEEYVSQMRPLAAMLPVLTDREACERWLRVLDFRPTPRSILNKKLGWHYIWRGSHVGGGIPAAIGMVEHLVNQWWPGQVDLDQWFQWYFGWLDASASAKTGYWQRAFWNLAYRKPTLIDMGGAVHFFWIYAARERPFPYPEPVIESTLPLQRSNGLYKNHPFCIDLDGNFCLIRAYLQLPESRQFAYRDQVYCAAERNFVAIAKSLTATSLEDIYVDSHGLPGALAALTECTKLPNFKYANALPAWQHPLNKVWWL